MVNDTKRAYRTKIARLDTKGKILDFSDLIDIQKKDDLLREGKVVLNFTEYAPGKASAKHYLDVAKARILFDDIVDGRFYRDADTNKFPALLEDYGGGAGAAAGHDEWQFCSRRLTVTFETEASNGELLKSGPAIRFCFEICEGVKGQTGQFTAKAGVDKIHSYIQVPLGQVRPAAATVLEYIQSCLIMWKLNQPADEVYQSQQDAA